MRTMLEDKHGRTASYMRVSVTDRCNLRCIYCAGEGYTFIPHPDILRYEEILNLIGLAIDLGVGKIRFTGGEPFVRLGFRDFMVDAAERFPDVDLCITTNATRIDRDVKPLAAAGIRKINISLDTLNPKKFLEITRQDLFDTVRANIDRCLEAGMLVKVNAVAVRGVNDDELPEFIEFAYNNPIDLRFIEFMPVGLDTGWADTSVWKSEDLLKEARQLATLEPVSNAPNRQHGPARMFSIVGGQGRIGLISPYTNHFCATCNRLRLTADGNLRTCLFSDKVYPLRDALRNPKQGLAAVEQIIRRANRDKPVGHELLERMAVGQGVCRTRMASIGG